MERRCSGLGFNWITFGVFPTNGAARRQYDPGGYRDAYDFMGKRLSPES